MALSSQSGIVNSALLKHKKLAGGHERVGQGKNRPAGPDIPILGLVAGIGCPVHVF